MYLEFQMDMYLYGRVTDIRAEGCIVKWNEGTNPIPSLVDTPISVDKLTIHEDEEEEEEEAEEEEEVLPKRKYDFKFSSLEITNELMCVRATGLINSACHACCTSATQFNSHDKGKSLVALVDMDPEEILIIPRVASIHLEKPTSRTPPWISIKIGVGKGKDYMQNTAFAVLSPSDAVGDVLNPFVICAASLATAKTSPTLKFAEVMIHEGVLKSDNQRMDDLKSAGSSLRISFATLYNPKKVANNEKLTVSSADAAKHMGR